MAQREVAISPCGLGKYLPGGLRSSSRLPSRPLINELRSSQSHSVERFARTTWGKN